MVMKVATLARLGEFLIECKALFASQTETEQNDINIENYVLNIDYENTLAFNTNQIVGDNSPYVGMATVGYTYVA